MKYTIISLISSLLFIISCSPKQMPAEDVLGVLQHHFTLEEGTQEGFEKGLLLLHNFEYDDALTAFEAASVADSTEVMTIWGEAMCHYKALWRLQNTEKGHEIMNRLGDVAEERLGNITDPLEHDLWKGLEIIYGEGEFDDRNDQYTAHMAQLHEEYPNNQEIAAFYALSLIWSTDEYGDGSDDLKLAASIADDIIKVNPLHPGALHYKIHALDGPTTADAAHKAADAYAKVAADAAHALHMPSHIYLALGEWDGVVNSNRVSYDASVKRMQKKELKDGARGYHSFAWLHYGLLQQGRYDEAQQVLDEMLEVVPNDPTKPARGYLLGMQNRQIVESGNINQDLGLDIDVKVDDIGLLAKSMRSFLRGQLAVKNEDVETINEEIEWLTRQRDIGSTQLEGNGIALCASGTSRYAPNENAIRSTNVVIEQLKGMKALMNKDLISFEASMKRATTLENETNYPAGPPRIVMPSFEMYGYWLLAQGQNEEAIAQFDKALLRMPKRNKSLHGKLQALKALGQVEEAKILEGEINGVLKRGEAS